MDRDKLSGMLTSFVDATPDEQGTIIADILDENDVMNNTINEYTSGVPSGFNNWKSAYSDLKSKYVKRFAEGDIGNTQPDNFQKQPISVEEASKNFVNYMFNK